MTGREYLSLMTARAGRLVDEEHDPPAPSAGPPAEAYVDLLFARPARVAVVLSRIAPPPPAQAR